MASGGMTEAQLKARGELPNIRPDRLFLVSCVALTCGSMMFAIAADIRLSLKHDFILTNEDVGWVLSAGWGFVAAMFFFGPLCDGLGMKWLMRLAFVLQAAGIALLMLAEGAWALYLGFFVNSLGSGAVEAVCNPLIATIYPDKKTQKLSQFHMWFPGGIVIGGVLCYALSAAGIDSWRLKIGLSIVPAIAYGLLLIGLDFPKTERVQSGVSFKDMCRETFTRPLFLVLLFSMCLTASLELGPMGWIPAVLQAGGIPGILVLVWMTGLESVLRYFAGPVVRKLTNPGTIVLGAIVAAGGLLLLSYPEALRWATRGYAPAWLTAGLAATVFAFGIVYFWPTMLGLAAERVPKGGALALAILGGTGSLFVGQVTTPLMGWIADQRLHDELVFKGKVGDEVVDRSEQTVGVLREVQASYAGWQASLHDTPQDRILKTDIQAVLRSTGRVLENDQKTGTLPRGATAVALRLAITNGPAGKEKGDRPDAEREAAIAKEHAAGILNPADNQGGLVSFRYIAPVAVVPVVIFGVLLLMDRRRGGFRQERIGRQGR
jgi:hypothetical protein